MRFVLLKKIQWLVLDLEVIRYKREFQESRGKILLMERKKEEEEEEEEEEEVKSLEVSSFVLQSKCCILAFLIF